jgi:DNA topoisomerase-1
VYQFTRNNETWNILGLRGHIITLDYPSGFNQWTKVAPADLINVEPYKKISETAIAATLKTMVDQNPYLIIATDYDREGELIGVEALNLAKEFAPNISEFKRAKFSAITSSEIQNAFQNLVNVDFHLSNAGEARQVIDLVWGAVLTRFISLTSRRLGKDFLSIGRVQSPTLALLVKREREIKEFVPTPFWQILARLKKEVLFTAIHQNEKFWDEQEAQLIFEKVKNSKQALVKTLQRTQEKNLPPSPFNTTSFLQSVSYLGFAASRAMAVAEELYVLGLISYPRTDNTVYPRSLNIRGILEKLRNSPFSKEVVEVLTNGRPYPTQGKKQTTDHPPIHPVGIPGGKKLSKDQLVIYELVCRRFLATLAKDAVVESTEVVFDISGEPFGASGFKILEANWRSIYPYIKVKRKPLPDLSEGEVIAITSMKLKEDKTKPPQRYSQGELIAKMESLSLGTKSTRHEIIAKLYSRKYIMGTPPRPTATAFAVIDALGDCDVVKPKMTAQLEDDMNAIAEGKKTLEETVHESRTMLQSVMESLEQEKEKIRSSITDALREQNTIGPCPVCGKPMVIRTSKNRKRFVACTGYPNCRNTYSLPQKGAVYPTETQCTTCGTPIVKVKFKGKRLWTLCLNSDCPSKQQQKEKK